MNRRQVLCGVGLGLSAGCLRFQADSSPDKTPEGASTSTPTGASPEQNNATSPTPANSVTLSKTHSTQLDDITATETALYGFMWDSGTRKIAKADLDGEIRWQGDSLADDIWPRQIVVAGDRLLVPTQTRSDERDQAALVAYRRSDGKRLWDHRAANSGISPIVVDGDTVFYGTDDSGSGDEQEPVIAALDTESGAVQWSQADLPAGFVSAISVHGSRVFVSLTSGAFGFDRESGARVQDLDVHAGFGGWAMAGTTLYLGEFGGVVAYDIESDTTRWKKETLGNIKSHPLLLDDTVVVGTEAGLVALDRDSGEQRWQTSTQLEIIGQPVTWQRYIWAGDGSGQIYGFSRSDGAIVYRSGYPDDGGRRTLVPTSNYLYLGKTAYELTS